MFVNKNGLISMKLEINNDFVILFNFLPQHLETHNVLIVLYVLYTVYGRFLFQLRSKYQKGLAIGGQLNDQAQAV